MGWLAAHLILVVLLPGNDPGGVGIEFALRSLEDNSPVPRAELVVERVAPFGTIDVQMEDVDGWIITRAESNDRGQITLEELPAVPMRLTLKAKGYVVPVIPAVDSNTHRHRFELLLPQATTVTGVVVDERGEPVSNVDVSIPVTIESRGRTFHAAVVPHGMTDARGVFRIEGVPVGMGAFRITDSEHSLSEDQRIYRWSDGPVQLRVRRLGVLRVEINAPLHRRGQYQITVVQQDVATKRPLKFEKQAADRGRIVFTDLPAGKYRVTAAIPSRLNPEAPLLADAQVDIGKPALVTLTAPE